MQRNSQMIRQEGGQANAGLSRLDQAVQLLNMELHELTPDLEAGLPQHIAVEKFLQSVQSAIEADPKLLLADRRSLRRAIRRAASDGLLVDGRESALVRFHNRDLGCDDVQYLAMTAGLLKKVRQSGQIASIDVHVVHEHDGFTYRPGLDEQPIFEPQWFGERGRPVGAYAIARMRDGTLIPAEIMSAAQINVVRQQSRAPNSLMWTKFWEEGARKTVLRRFSKRLPMSSDLIGQIFGGEEGLTLPPQAGVPRLVEQSAHDEGPLLIDATGEAEAEAVRQPEQRRPSRLDHLEARIGAERQQDQPPGDGETPSAPADAPHDDAGPGAASPEVEDDDPYERKAHLIVGDIADARSERALDQLMQLEREHMDTIADARPDLREMIAATERRRRLRLSRAA